MRRALPLIFVLALGTGCLEVLPIEPAGSALMLVGVVVEGADSAFIRIGTTSGDRELAPVAVSSMTLLVGDRSIPLAEAQDDACGGLAGLGCWAARLEPSVRSHDSLRIAATIADGRGVTGRARVPARPDLRLDGFPNDTARLAALEDHARLLGEAAPGSHIGLAHETARATVWSSGTARTCQVLVQRAGPGPFVTTAFRVAAPECDGAPVITWDSLSAAVTLHAYDENFTGWITSGHIPPVEPGTWGVTGAHGVFGAAVPRTFIVIVHSGEPGG